MEDVRSFMEALDAMRPILKMLAGMAIIMGFSGLAGYCMGPRRRAEALDQATRQRGDCQVSSLRSHQAG